MGSIEAGNFGGGGNSQENIISMWEMEMKHDFVLTSNGNYRNNLHYLRPKVKVAATAAAEVTAIAGNQLRNAGRKLLQVESTMGPKGH